MGFRGDAGFLRARFDDAPQVVTDMTDPPAGEWQLGRPSRSTRCADDGIKVGQWIVREAHVLRKASMTVHSIVPISKPAAQEIEADEDEAGDDPQDEPATEEPRVYYEIDVTITPSGSNDGAVWEPSELILTSQPIASLEGLEEHEVGTTYECLLWNGSVFVEDEIGKHPGEQRLKLTVDIKPGTREAWLQYYQERIGRLELPEWRSSAAKEV